MPRLRQTFRVQWGDGHDVTLLTTVRDVMAAVNVVTGIPELDAENRVTGTTAIIWSALSRHGHPVGPYLDWLDELDSYDEVPTVAAGVDDPEGPTNPGPSATGPSGSRSTPARTGAAGSTTTPGRSKPRKKS